MEQSDRLESREYGIFLVHWSAWVGLRAAGEARVPFLIGVWALGATAAILVDFFPTWLEPPYFLRRFAAALIFAVVLGWQRDALFAFADQNLGLVTGAGNEANWIVLVTVFAVANAVARRLSLARSRGRIFLRLSPLAGLMILLVRAKVLAL